MVLKKIMTSLFILKNFLNDKFKVDIFIQDDKVIPKVVDLESGEEYYNIYYAIQNGKFVNKVREELKNILLNIKEKCFDSKYFIFDQSNRCADYIKERYQVNPEFLWQKYKGYGVFRKKENNKWFGVIMNIDYSKLENKKGEIEIINLKLDPEKVGNLINKQGFYKSYHMNSKNWISVILNDSIDDNELFDLINESYSNV